MYCYVEERPNLFVVGFWSPDKVWHADTAYKTRGEASDRVHWMNGGNGST